MQAEKLDESEVHPNNIPDTLEHTNCHWHLALDKLNNLLDVNRPLEKSDIPLLREHWFCTSTDIMNGAPAHLPPFCIRSSG